MTSDVLPRVPKWPAEASANQRRMFSASVKYGDHPQVIDIYTVSGALDVNRLRRAWADVLSYHAVLLAPLNLTGDKLCAMEPALGDGRVSLTVVTDDSVRNEQWLNNWLKTEISNCRADAIGTPGQFLPRLRLVTDGVGYHVLLMVVDHLFSDGRSSSILLSDLAQAYNGRPLRVTRLDYYDWALWDRQRRLSPEYLHVLDSWREVLPPPEEMRNNWLRRDAGASTESAAAVLRPRLVAAEQIRAQARSASSTPFAVALDALARAVREVSGHELRSVITGFHNRSQAGTLRLVGYFAHNGVIALPEEWRPDFNERIAALGNSIFWSARNSVTSHREIREHVWPDLPGAERYSALSEIVFSYDSTWGKEISFAGTVAHRYPDAALGDFDDPYEFYTNGLNLWLEEDQGQLYSTIAYRRDVISDSMVRALAACFARNLSAV